MWLCEGQGVDEVSGSQICLNLNRLFKHMLHERLFKGTQKSELFYFSLCDSDNQLGWGSLNPMIYQVPLVWNILDDRSPAPPLTRVISPIYGGILETIS